MPYVKNRYNDEIRYKMGEVKSRIYTSVSDLEIVCYRTKEPVSYENRTTGEKLDLRIDDKWGNLWDCGWFHFTGKVPESAKGLPVVLLIDVNGEGCIFDKGGNPMRGITSVEQDFCGTLSFAGKRVFQYVQESEGNELVDIWMDAGCNGLFGNYTRDGHVSQANIATLNSEMRSLFYDMQVLSDLLNCLDENSARYNKILFTLYDVSNLLKTYSAEEIADARALVQRELNKKGGDPSLRFTAIGHAHIDLAWLWPIRETIRKGARTFSTALELMDRYPDYKFGASQPQLYAWMKEYYPGLYKRIQQKVKEGRWEVQGCMWVEADTNISGGEALVRQIVYGKKFFKEEFGIDVKNLWLPDVFGYSGVLPQLLKKSGCDYFMTQKLSWNNYDTFPHHTFNWQGIDGSQVFTHMLPENTYNGAMHPATIKKAELSYKENGCCDEALILFGIGDGGGGPGPDHLERAKRMKNLEGICPIEQGFAQPLFERMKKNCTHIKTWAGELYLENHQGTYTTQAQNKRYNRKMEIALRELEFSLAFCGNGKEYPKEELDKIWKEVLLYQFHDILPGSSIARVYEESTARYRIMLDQVTGMTQQLYREKAGELLTVYNSLSWEREVILKNDDKFYKANIPAMGCTTAVKALTEFEVAAENNILENSRLKVTFGEDGSVLSVFDKTDNKEGLRGKSNVFSLYDDVLGDCWNIGIEYTDKEPEVFVLKTQRFYTDGPFAVCEQEYELNTSKIKLKAILAQSSPRIDFEAEVDWRENLKMLRTAFDVDINANYASFEIQFGKITRPNNDNTMWQMAQFEVCAHKWVDLSEAGYGVALLNDCKYGYRVKGNIIDIDLLRSQNHPGKNADRGFHKFTYSLYPHRGAQDMLNVTKQAYELNIPAQIVQGKVAESGAASGNLFAVTDGAVIETVKRAEDDNATVVRVFEPQGSSVDSILTISDQFRKAFRCDLIESDQEEVKIENHQIAFHLKPFEIVTFKFYR